MKNGTQIRWKLRSDHEDNQRDRRLLDAAAGHADHAPQAPRRPARAAAPAVRKQTGRRYGPLAKNPPHPGMQAPEPLSTVVRALNYRIDGVATWGAYTARQVRQINRMAARAAGVARRPEAKGRPTPKRDRHAA